MLLLNKLKTIISLLYNFLKLGFLLANLTIFVCLEVSDIDKYYALFLKVYTDYQVVRDLEEVDGYPSNSV